VSTSKRRCAPPLRTWRVLVSAPLLLLSACAGVGVDPDRVIVADDVRVLGSGGLAALVSVEENQLRFSAGSAEVDALAPGHVVVASVSELTPYGLVRRIEDRVPQNGSIVLHTSAASLGEVFVQGRLSFSRSLEPSDLEAVADSVVPEADESGFVIGFDDVALDEGGAVRVSGNLTLIASIDELTIVFGPSGIEEIVYGVSVSQGASLELVGDGAAELDTEVMIAPPLVFPSTVVNMLGVPVVVTPVMEFFAGVEGQLTGAFRAAATQSSEYSVHAAYRDGSLQVEESHAFDAQGEPLEVDGFAHARVFTGPRLEVLLNGVSGPEARADAYAESTALFEGSPPCLTWELAGGLQADVGVGVLDYATTAFDVRKSLGDSAGCTGVVPPSAWSRTLVGALEGVQSVEALADGGFIVAGYETHWGNVSPLSTWVSRLDAAGNVLWIRSYDGIDYPGAIAVVEGDGFLVGSGGPYSHADAAVITRLGVSGDVRWSKALRSEDGRGLMVRSVKEWPGGGFAVVGTIGYGIESDVWVAVLEGNGDVTWSKRFGGPDQDYADDLLVRSDGHLMVLATSSSFSEVGDSDYWMVAVDASGEPVWQRAYGGIGYEWASAAAPAGSGGYLLVGTSETYQPPGVGYSGSHGLLVHVDHLGFVLTTLSVDPTASDSFHDDSVTDVIATPDGGIVLAGATVNDLWLFKAGGAGSWSRLYGGTDRDTGGMVKNDHHGVGNHLLQTGSGEIAVFGSSRSFSGGGPYEPWLMQVTETGTIPFNVASGATTRNVSGNVWYPTVESWSTDAVVVDAPLDVSVITQEVAPIAMEVGIRIQAP
jgi:hypothetical protein